MVSTRSGAIQYGGNETVEQRQNDSGDRHYHFDLLESLSLRHLLKTEPWVFIPEGSLLGYFDWVPEEYRIGKWSRYAPVVFGSFLYLWLLGGVYLHVTSGWNSISSHVKITDYPPVDSLLWWYHAGGFFWMSFVASSIYFGPAGGKAWATYTVWSWTILTARHGLCALAPWLPSTAILEATRFPALLTTSVVFVLWNFVVGPFIYVFGMTTPHRKRLFLKYFTNFRLTQLHVNIIIFSIMNTIVASPKRSLQFADFYYALSVSLLYMMFYLLILDRIGVHTYPIFTPRSDWCVVTYSGVFVVHVLAYCFWSPIVSHGYWRQAIMLWLGQ